MPETPEIGFDLRGIFQVLADDIKARKKLGDPKYLMTVDELNEQFKEPALRQYTKSRSNP